MKDRQVEVVTGGHAVARIDGALVVVANRGLGRLTPQSPAVLALESLAELIREVSEQQPTGPGALVARQATRWLMKHAEQISPGQPIDFGVLSAAESGGVAIFLHGSVTAVLAGDGTFEQYRGRDAAFTVDRVASVPARAVALFVDDARGRIPELPAERGIGWLVEGIAQAGGAIVWSDPVRGRSGVVEHSDPHRHIPPTARVGPDVVASADPDVAPSIDPNPVPSADPDLVPSVDPDADLYPTGTQAATAMLDSDQDQHALDPHHAPTQLGGTNPVPQPDPDLQRRLEATAKATFLTVKVLGFKCARAHPSDPRSAFCTVCGMPVDQTQQLIEVVRPPLGMLILDDGITYLLAADAVLGRDPEHSEQARRGMIPLKVDDSSGGMSRAHAEIMLVNWDVSVVDRGSTNGTRTRMPGYRDWVRLGPNQPMMLVPGAELMIGNRVLRFEPAAPPPFG
ncbi:FHA domain-containing protein [Nocardia sp. KC 131]|uniref:FHA domain-containing protein n=1 Tax=Nocardia arseniciresistens TaxID=3392119 RepID=UPI00398F54AD